MPLAPQPLCQPILEQRALRLLEVLSEKKLRGVYKVTGQDPAVPLILKVNKLFPAKLGRESAFLRLASLREFRHLKLPRILDHGPGWMLMEHVRLVPYTRDSVLEKDWSAEQIERWVGALYEFQSIPQSSAGFRVREKLKGACYPLLRFFELRKAVRKRVRGARLLQLAWMLFQYLCYRPFLRQVTTHYDLNTFNFTNEAGSDRMLMIDFEAGAFRGDRYYDILYYLTLPTVSLDQWTFQRRLLREWVRRAESDRRFLPARLRLQLILLCIQRIQRFHDAPDKAEVYVRSLDTLFDRAAYGRWLQGLTAD